MIDFSDTNKLLRKIQFCVIIDYSNKDDLLLLQEIINNLNEKL